MCNVIVKPTQGRVKRYEVEAPRVFTGILPSLEPAPQQRRILLTISRTGLGGKRLKFRCY